MILNHRHDHEYPDLPQAIAKDEGPGIGRTRCPEGIETDGKHKSLVRYEKYNLQFEIYFSRRISNQDLWTYPSRRVGRRY